MPSIFSSSTSTLSDDPITSATQVKQEENTNQAQTSSDFGTDATQVGALETLSTGSGTLLTTDLISNQTQPSSYADIGATTFDKLTTESFVENLTSTLSQLVNDSFVTVWSNGTYNGTGSGEAENKGEQIGDLSDHIWEVPHLEPLFVWGFGVCLWFGTFGNILSLITMQRPKLRSQSTTVYLSTLAISDTLMLWVINQDEWFHKVVGRSIVTVPCNIRTYIMAIVSSLSSWCVVAVTGERFIAVRFPLKAIIWNRPKKSRIIMVIITLVLAAAFSVYLVAYRESPLGCIYSPGFEYFALNVGSPLLTVMRAIAPGLILCVLNFLIIYELKKTQKSLARSNSVTGAAGSRNNDVRSITISVVVVSVTHIILTLPVTIVISIQDSQGNIFSKVDSDSLLLLQFSCEVISYADHSINFILYMVSSVRFRHELLCLLTCGRREKSSRGGSTFSHSSHASMKSVDKGSMNTQMSEINGKPKEKY